MNQSLVELNDQPLSVSAVKEQVNLIQHVLREVMQDGQHYGKIPGCGDKPTLLKPGAEKIMMTFRMAADPEVEVVENGDGHREYRVSTRLTTMNSGMFLGKGVGCCSTMESKWRYRTQTTGQEVPKAYWKTRDSELLGGPQYSTKKISGTWMICEKIEHDNPADYYNTCLKMAKKRSLVDAILTATAASDIFTQDLEDMAQNGVVNGEAKAAPAKEEKKVSKPAAASSPMISELQIKRMFAIARRSRGTDDEKASAWSDDQIKNFLLNEYSYESSSEIKKGDQYKEICDYLAAHTADGNKI